jgi:hypothetical protein
MAELRRREERKEGGSEGLPPPIDICLWPEDVSRKTLCGHGVEGEASHALVQSLEIVFNFCLGHSFCAGP